jgi:fermentation-respiration switch protein FrsA (DUF1100 family)
MRRFWRLTRSVLIVYLAVLLLLMLLEEWLIFFPSKYPQGNWQPVGLAVEDAHFAAGDGTRLHGWYVEHKKPRAVVLFAHGNAGNLSHRAEMLRILHDRVGVSVLIFDYRGYGRSDGSPNEEGILDDARAARAWLGNRAHVDPSDIVLLGRSLGGGVMVDLAARDGARALVLESAFTSLPDAAAHHYPWAPVRLLMRTRLDSLRKITSYHGPLLQSHGDADEVIPYELGRRLYNAAPGTEKKFLTLPHNRHNDPQPAWYYDELQTFLNKLEAPPAKR